MTIRVLWRVVLRMATVISLLLFAGCGKGKLHNDKVAVICSEYTDVAETDSLVSLLDEIGYDVTILPLDDISSEVLKGVKTIVWHRLDTVEISADELAAKDIVMPFVERGGSLMLTLDAVRLLNAWEIESRQLEVRYEDAVDEGFGRPLGFHGYREHPIYEGLFGGAYTWKATFDHKARTIGFSGTDLPKAPGSEILGVNWAYIRYHEDRKLVWTVPVGDGRILAVGGYLYFEPRNLNRSTLKIFMENAVDWLCGNRKFRSDEMYWVYDTIPVKEVPFPDYIIPVRRGKEWIPEKSAISGERICERSNFWSINGQQVAAFGREVGKIEEVWFHPVMGLRDMSFGVRYAGTDEVVWIETMPAIMTKSPYYFERRYDLGGGRTVTEIMNAHPEKPLFTVSYRWDDPTVEEVYVSYRSNLRLMWPYSHNATGTLLYSNEGAATAVFDRRGDLNAVTAFDMGPAEVEKTEEEGKSVFFIYRFPADRGRLGFYMSGGEGGLDSSFDVLRSYMGRSEKVYDASKSYYDGFARDFLSIHSDDTTFNKAYQWALVSVDNFFTHTPSLGKSLTAGLWGTSRGWNGGHAVSGRPGYVWYFGRDTEFTGMAMTDYGDYEKVREIIKTFGKYQDPDGKVYHEMTTSGSVHYDAADATPLYVVLSGYYLRKSGDIDFIRSQWDCIRKALNFCYSTDTDGDGLIENTNVGHGWQECWQLYGAHTEVYLAAIWTQALLECKVMAELFGDEELASRCSEDAERCRRILDDGFWNDDLEFYNHGLMRDGSWQEYKCVLGHAPVFFGLADKDKSVKTCLNFSNRYFSTDWGVRMVGYDSPFFALGGYTYGNIWPFHNGCAATAEYRAGLRFQGFRHAYSNLRLFETWDYGNIAEVIRGDRLDFTGIAAHQQWSSAMNLYPLYQGMLGIAADALSDSISLSPAFPVDWNEAEVRNIRTGDRTVHMDYTRTEASYTYILDADDPVNMKFTAILPLAVSVESVAVDGISVEFVSYDDVQNVCVEIPPFCLSGVKEVKVNYTGGIGVMLNLQPVRMGMEDDGIRIERESYDRESGIYMLEMAGLGGKEYEVDVMSASEVVSVSGADVVCIKDGIVTLRVPFVGKADNCFTGTVVKMKLK